MGRRRRVRGGVLIPLVALEAHLHMMGLRAGGWGGGGGGGLEAAAAGAGLSGWLTSVVRVLE